MKNFNEDSPKLDSGCQNEVSSELPTVTKQASVNPTTEIEEKSSLIKRGWKWIGDGENNKALSVIIQLLTLGAAVYFGFTGISKIADISVNLREIKADVVEAGQVRTDSVNLPGGWSIENQ